MTNVCYLCRCWQRVCIFVHKKNEQLENYHASLRIKCYVFGFGSDWSLWIVSFHKKKTEKCLNLHKRNANKMTKSTSESCYVNNVLFEAHVNIDEISTLNFSWSLRWFTVRKCAMNICQMSFFFSLEYPKVFNS